MGCYNGFNVYRRDNSGNLVYVDELSGCVSGMNDTNEIWQVGWTGHFLSVPEKQIIFNKEFDGTDAFFPTIDTEEWEISEQSDTLYDEKNNLEYIYITYSRKNKQ